MLNRTQEKFRLFLSDVLQGRDPLAVLGKTWQSFEESPVQTGPLFWKELQNAGLSLRQLESVQQEWLSLSKQCSYFVPIGAKIQKASSLSFAEMVAGILSAPLACAQLEPLPEPMMPPENPPDPVLSEHPCLDEPANQNVDLLLRSAVFHSITVPGQNGWPSQVIHIQEDLLSDEEENQLSRHVANQVFSCGDKMVSSFRHAVPLPHDQHHLFIVSEDYSITGSIFRFNAGTPATFVTTGEKIFRLSSGLDDTWRQWNPEKSDSQQCFDSHIAHELAHHIKGRSLLQRNPARSFEEGGAENLALQNLQPFSPSSFSENEIHLIESSSDKTLLGLHLNSGMNSLELYLSYRNWDLGGSRYLKILEIRSVDTEELLNTLTVSHNEKNYPALCEKIDHQSKWPAYLQGAYVCFLRDPHEEGQSELKGKFIVTTQTSAAKSYTCDEGLQAAAEQFTLNIGNQQAVWTHEPYRFGEYGNDPRSYGTGYCFWQFIKQTYGEESYLKIMRKFEREGLHYQQGSMDALQLMSETLAEEIREPSTKVYKDLKDKLENVFHLSMKDLESIMYSTLSSFCPEQ